jgi:hypothetical protein
MLIKSLTQQTIGTGAYLPGVDETGLTWNSVRLANVVPSHWLTNVIVAAGSFRWERLPPFHTSSTDIVSRPSHSKPNVAYVCIAIYIPQDMAQLP